MKKSFSIILLLFTGWTISSAQLALKNKGLPCVNKTFQVHGHVILDSLGNANIGPEGLAAGLAAATEAFAPICVSFELCSVDTITNYEFDSIGLTKESDEMKKLFHHNNRINIYMPAVIYDPPIGGFASICGIKNPSNGLVFISSTGALIHEFGHLFGLLHTFEGSGEEQVDGSNCLSHGDMICDTPADPYVDGEDFSDYINLQTCEFISSKVDSSGRFYQPDVGNYMSYYPCACGFTRGQYIKMAESVLSSDPKMW